MKNFFILLANIILIKVTSGGMLIILNILANLKKKCLKDIEFKTWY